MKVLFINPLRIGDTFMSMQVIKALAENEPKAQIDYLAFDESIPLKNLFDLPINFYFLPRKKIQQIALDLSYSNIKIYDELETSLNFLNKEKYDLVINYANTRLSTYIASMSCAKKKLGAHYNEQGVLNYGSKWLEYLDKVSSKHTGLFHFNELFLNALNLKNVKKDIIAVSSQAKLATNHIISSKKPYVVCQFHSSDVKKDLPQNIALDLIDTIEKLGFKVVLPCAPNEEETCQQRYKGKNITPCRFDALATLIKNANYVVSVDTSTKQLASLLDANLIEISLGSSKVMQTGPFNHGAICVQPLSSCYPCSHSSKCNQQYICQTQINSQEICNVVTSVLRDDFISDTKSIMVSSVMKEDNFYFLINNSKSLSKELLTKINLYRFLSNNNELCLDLIYKVHRKFDLLVLKEKLIKIEDLRNCIQALRSNLSLSSPVKNFVFSNHYQTLEEELEKLNFPNSFLNLEQIPSNNKFSFTLLRQAQNFLNESDAYLKNMRSLILDIESEGVYETGK